MTVIPGITQKEGGKFKIYPGNFSVSSHTQPMYTGQYVVTVVGGIYFKYLHVFHSHGIIKYN